MKCHQQAKATEEESFANQNGGVSKESLTISNANFKIISGRKEKPVNGYWAVMVGISEEKIKTWFINRRLLTEKQNKDNKRADPESVNNEEILLLNIS